MRAGRVILIVVLALVGVVILLAIIGLLGGPQTLWLSIKPAPDPASLSRQRTAAFKTLDAELENAISGLGLKQFGEGRADQCYRGANDLKSSSGFANQCTAKISRFYGLNGDFRTFLLDFDSSVSSKGWINPDDTTPVKEEIIEERFDREHHQPNRRTGEIMLVSDLPRPYYYRGDDSKLDIGYAERLTSAKPIDVEIFGRTFQSILPRSAPEIPKWDKKRFVQTTTLFPRITKDHEYVIAVSVEKIYFQN